MSNYGYGSREARRRRRMRRKVMQTVIPIAVAILLIAVIGIIALKTGLFESFTYSSDKADLNDYFQCTSMDTATVIRDGEITEDRILVKDGTCYWELEKVKSEYNDRFYYDVNDSALLYTTAEGVISAPVGQTVYRLGEQATQTDYVTSFLQGETLYVALDYVRLYANFEFNLCGGGNEPYRIEIKNEWGNKVYADLDKDSAVRIDTDKKSEILRELREGTTVEIISSETEDWMKVMTDDLLIGFIEKKHLKEKYEQAETPVTGAQEVVVPTVADGSTVVLAWHNVTNTDSASYLSDFSSQFANFNTISPTWFYLADNEGNIESIASHDYVDMAHNAGLKVWGLVENMTHNEVSTFDVLSYSSKRAHLIEQLLSLAREYNLDGINVDFESLPAEAGEPFVQFIRELSLAAHKEGLVISVDNYVPQGYTQHYNRKEQGVFADYVVIMGYDEHFSGSSEAGSVASLGFVLEGIEKTLEDVPANKVINAMPFYTRIWTETPKSEAEINQGAGEEGFLPYTLEVQTVSAADAYASASSNGANIVWNEESGQNYAEWTKGDGTVKCWLEDGESMKARLDVMKAHNLAGVAVWQLAYGSDGLWEPIRAAYPAH